MPFGTLSQSYSLDCATPQARVSDYYVVPIDKSFGYDALTHNLPPNSTKYFAIGGAYPPPCTTFGVRQCAGNDIIRSSSILRQS